VNQIIDDKAWFEACLNTPLGQPRAARSPDEAMRTPGCCVKSRALCSRTGLPRDTGVLASFDDGNNSVLVRGHGDHVSPKFVWMGTILEYFATWDCDVVITKRGMKLETDEQKARRLALETITLLQLSVNDLINGVAPYATERARTDGGHYTLRLFDPDSASGGRLLVTYTSHTIPGQVAYTSVHYLDEYRVPMGHSCYVAWRNLVLKRDALLQQPA
jgi:hypothetical protein